MVKVHSSDEIQQQAAIYVARLHSGELTASEEIAIQNWCSSSAAHRREFQHQIAIWDSCTQLYEASDSDMRKPKYKMAFGIAAAAMIVLAVSFLSVLPGSMSNSERPDIVQQVDLQTSPYAATDQTSNTYITQVGEVRTITLADNTQVTLNTDTQINVAFSDTVRELTLVRGEAFFDVAKDPAKVFVIHSGERTIRVIGTKFNVRKNTDSLQVAVTEGLVAVHSTSEPRQGFEHKPDDTLLRAGTIGAFSTAGQLISTDQTDKVNRLQSWRTGQFRFDNETMQTVVDELSRYQSKPIVLVGDKVKNLRISGVYSLSDQTTLFEVLEQVLPIRVTNNRHQILIEIKKS
ncbi:MAG: FecR domain-containing protein [Alteromonadaceae bacterium]|nr:FecR domain-containing protein [Alteromonadaceae bacterium]